MLKLLEAVPAPEGSPRVEVVLVRSPEGIVSLEFVPLREGVARAFLRQSPRNPKLSRETLSVLSDKLSALPYSRILVQDSRKGTLRKALGSAGWGVERAIRSSPMRNCRSVTTYDLPMDERLVDSAGSRPDISNTSHMNGISLDLGDRKAWAFFTDDGETARIISEAERRQGLLVANSTEDMFEAAESLVQFLAAMKKSWAVFSTDLGRFVRKFDPITMWRMNLDRPTPYLHSAQPLSGRNRRMALTLFSEYYDEPFIMSALRLRRLRSDGWYSIYLMDGGFVITRIEGDTGLIYDIYVTPSKQGHGLGKELMRCAINSLAGRVSSCYLHTSYPRAKALYEGFGFRTVYAQLGLRLDEIALTPPRALQSLQSR